MTPAGDIPVRVWPAGATPDQDDPALSHGTRNGYRRGCRCADCRAWNAAKARAKYWRDRAAQEPQTDCG